MFLKEGVKQRRRVEPNISKKWSDCYITPREGMQRDNKYNKDVEWSQILAKSGVIVMSHQGNQRIRIFIVHKEANFDLWDQSIHVVSPS